MKQMLAIAAGGALGAVMRWYVAGFIQRLSGSAFPWGTLTVNIVGSFLLGFLFVWMLERVTVGELARLAVTVGFLGAFTTFSTFSVETARLLQEGAFSMALGNVLAQVLICVTLAWLGMQLARIL
ncbi:MAG: fluoride efflux transporter CrcB [Zetaproteobacteria bacterium]|nr:fluoride efflux transporter CrcB [Zetaproteobacteria bacterium]